MNEIPVELLNQFGAGQSPFGDLTPSARLRQRLSQGSGTACANLLSKAIVALDHGDPEAADRYLRRAASKPFDHHEGVWPVLWEAHMLLHGLVTDTLEQSEYGDSRWLDVSLAVLDGAPASAQDEMLRVLRAIASDYEVEKSELARIARHVGTVTPALPAEDRNIDLEQRRRMAKDVAELCGAFVHAADQAGIAPPQ